MNNLKLAVDPQKRAKNGMEVVEYVTVCAPDLCDLDQRVMEYIRDGWQPLGGVGAVVYRETSGELFIQAMVKYA